MSEKYGYDTDDILQRNVDKRKKDSCQKGKRGENGLCKILSARFGKPFSRVPQSGAKTKQVDLSLRAREAYSGDIVVPDDFLFCLESKHGYNDVDIVSTIGAGKNKTIDSFLEQATKDAEGIHKMPLVCWKKDRRPWLAFLKACPGWDDALAKVSPVRLHYREWIAYDLKSILVLPDTFWFARHS